MKYFLDFDGVIFDIESFKVRIEALGFADAPRRVSLFDALRKKDPKFDVSSFVFPDALSFLQAHTEDCFIVSSYLSSNPLFNEDPEEAAAYQTKKIILAGIADLVGTECVHVVGKSKQETLSLLQKTYAPTHAECLFIDDKEIYVQEALALGMQAMLMKRTLGETKTDLQRIASFAELSSSL